MYCCDCQTKSDWNDVKQLEIGWYDGVAGMVMVVWMTAVHPCTRAAELCHHSSCDVFPTKHKMDKNFPPPQDSHTRRACEHAL